MEGKCNEYLHKNVEYMKINAKRCAYYAYKRVPVANKAQGNEMLTDFTQV